MTRASNTVVFAGASILTLFSALPVAGATTIDFQTYATGTALTSLDGITFSLVGGPDSSGPPLIGYDDDPPRGLSNSTNPGYPTATILDFSFSSPVSGVSFYFNNYSDNGLSYYQAFGASGNLLASGDLSSEDGLENNILSVSGIKNLQFNNGEGGAASWYFAVPSVTFTGGSAVPEPSSWAMMMLGFAGLGLAGYRASRRTSAA